MSIPYLLHIIGWNSFFMCKLHYFNTLTNQSNTAIHDYCENGNSISERVKERKTFMRKHTQHRIDLFFLFQKWLLSHSAVAERAHKTCIITYTTWLSPEMILRTSSLIIWFHIYRLLSPGCLFGQRHFFFFPLLCAVELDFCFPAAYIPWRKRKLIHEVPICIKCRNICHKILVGGLKHQEIVPLIICLNTIEFCFCQQELSEGVWGGREKRVCSEKTYSYYYLKWVIAYMTPSHTNTQEWALPQDQ